MSEPNVELKEPIIIDNPEQKITYANLGQVSVSPEEVVLHFGIRTNESNVANGVAKIYLSLPHAKRLVIAWASLIQQHEELFGEINLDPTTRLTPKGKEYLDKFKEKR
jgi:hypothetical protein